MEDIKLPLAPKELRKPAQFKHYQPKRWHPEFTLVVMGSISGKTNLELASEFGYTHQHISNILSTSQAEEIREKVRLGLDKHFEGTIIERVNRIGEKAIQKIESFVEDEHNYADKAPFAFVDRMMKLAIMTSKMGSDMSNGKGSTNIQVNGTAAFVLNPDQAAGIRSAMIESARIETIEPGSIPDKDIASLSNNLKLVKNG